MVCSTCGTTVTTPDSIVLPTTQADAILIAAFTGALGGALAPAIYTNERPFPPLLLLPPRTTASSTPSSIKTEQSQCQDFETHKESLQVLFPLLVSESCLSGSKICLLVRRYKSWEKTDISATCYSGTCLQLPTVLQVCLRPFGCVLSGATAASVSGCSDSLCCRCRRLAHCLIKKVSLSCGVGFPS